MVIDLQELARSLNLAAVGETMRAAFVFMITLAVEMLSAGVGPVGLASIAAAAERETRAAQTSSSVPNADAWGKGSFVDDRARVKDFVNLLLESEAAPSAAAKVPAEPSAPAAAK
jgi:hypothetical protein